MYAVVRTGGKQVRVAPGKAVRVETLPGAVGERVAFDEVLMVAGEGEPRLGRPLVTGARVVGTILRHGRARKITIFKSKRRKNYRRKQGHRQDFTEVRVEAIEG
jgi:large subunit ribosomal protein L21